jgi:hypothetical protein
VPCGNANSAQLAGIDGNRAGRVQNNDGVGVKWSSRHPTRSGRDGGVGVREARPAATVGSMTVFAQLIARVGARRLLLEVLRALHTAMALAL